MNEKFKLPPILTATSSCKEKSIPKVTTNATSISDGTCAVLVSGEIANKENTTPTKTPCILPKTENSHLTK